MRTAVIYVFSGTGNTLLAAEMVAQALRKRDISADVCRIHEPFSDAPQPSGYDIACFAYPIHAFNAPQFFLRFVRALPKAEGMPAYIFKTSGEPFAPNHASSSRLVRILRKKGYKPFGDVHLLLPYNIMFRYPDALVKQMYLHTQDMAEVIAARIDACRPEPLRYNPLTVTCMYLLRLQWFGAWINGPMISADKTKCSGCGICAANCPAANISMKNGRPHFGAHCTMCMSCAMRCPKKAIRPGFLTPWLVNGLYPYEKLASDPSVQDSFINADTRGYFRLFLPYYRRTQAEIAALSDTPPKD